MKPDEFLLDRLRNILLSKHIEWEEKKMMGGVCFMVDDKMCFGTFRGGLMARIDPENLEALLSRNGAEQMTLGERTMKGYLSIDAEAYDADNDLEFWIEECLAFNPKAKSSKKRKKRS